MALPTTGPLALSLDIRTEELIKNPSLPEDNVSMREISESAGFNEPDAISEFYGYSSAILPTMASIRVSGGPNDTYIAFAATPATNGFVAITSRGFYFGTDSRGPQYNTRYQVDTSNSLAEFSKGFGGLSSSRTYYCWGYVQNQIGEGYTTRGAATTLPAIPISDYTQSYSGSVYMNIYGQNWTSTANYYGWGNRGFGNYYLHPYYGWVAVAETNGGLPQNGDHYMGAYYSANFKRAPSGTQIRKKYWGYHWSQIEQWNTNINYQSPYYADVGNYYSGGQNPTSHSGGGQGEYIQPGYNSWAALTYYSGNWYSPYQFVWSNRNVTTGGNINFQESWEWNGYALTN